MLKLMILFHVVLHTKYHDLRAARRKEHGSVTIEHVLWAVAVIAIVGIVVAAITSYVQAQSGKIK